MQKTARPAPRALPSGVLVALGVVIPVVTCLVLSAARGRLENSTAALILVLVIVAAAATGSRAAGWTAAAVSALGFDFFLTAPYLQLRINDPTDVETAVLLLVIGAAVTEVALWGRRQQARASEQQGYLDGILQATDSMVGAVPDQDLIDHLAEQIRIVLGVDRVNYVAAFPADRAVLQRDGSLIRSGRVVDVDDAGLPTDVEVMIPVGRDDPQPGAFEVVAATKVRRPSRQQRQVAVTLAERAMPGARHTPPV